MVFLWKPIVSEKQCVLSKTQFEISTLANQINTYLTGCVLFGIDFLHTQPKYAQHTFRSKSAKSVPRQIDINKSSVIRIRHGIEWRMAAIDV